MGFPFPRCVCFLDNISCSSLDKAKNIETCNVPSSRQWSLCCKIATMCLIFPKILPCSNSQYCASKNAGDFSFPCKHMASCPSYILITVAMFFFFFYKQEEDCLKLRLMFLWIFGSIFTSYWSYLFFWLKCSNMFAI